MFFRCQKYVVQLHHVHRAANHGECSHEDQGEVANVDESLTNQSDKEGKTVEESEPIEDFEPEEKKHKGCNQALYVEGGPHVRKLAEHYERRAHVAQHVLIVPAQVLPL